MGGNIIELNDATFDEQVRAVPGVAVVKFWATFCPPCRMLDPIVDRIAAETHPGVTFFGMNADENPATMMSQRVMGTPTIRVFRNGVVVKTILGAKPEPALRAELALFLGDGVEVLA